MAWKEAKNQKNSTIKKDPETIRKMFDSISQRYDFLNSFLSLYQDKKWRKNAARRCLLGENSKVIDVACGTGSLSFTLARMYPDKNIRIVGIDFSKKMIDIAKQKSKQFQQLRTTQSNQARQKSMRKLRRSHASIDFKMGDAQKIPYPDATFDCATIGFGLRNVADADKSISEMSRVLKREGRMVMLELGTPENKIFRKIYLNYFQKILPLIGWLLSGNKKAYKYLPSSVVSFYSAEDIKKMMEDNGFSNIKTERMTFGVSFICHGIKK